MKVFMSLAMCCLALRGSEALNDLTSADLDKSGSIDRNEFYWANPDADLYAEFGKLDANNDGFIDLSVEIDEEVELGRQDLVVPRCMMICRNRNHCFVLRPRFRSRCLNKCRRRCSVQAPTESPPEEIVEVEVDGGDY